jgi:cell division protein FtsZ
MMGTGEAEGDNRAIEAAEKAISNPLLDGVSMKGAKGVIISITGGEDMRLMEVDEAASHIKELVDPDANIIWGSAFNNDLQGKIRVSVVATGIDAEANVQAPPAKVFAFPGARQAEAPKAVVPQPEPEPDIAPEPEVEELSLDDSMQAADESEIAADAGADDGEELLLDSGDMVADEAEQDESRSPSRGSRSWLAEQEEASAPAPARREGGTLFERMSSIARGAAKAQVEEDESQPRQGRDPLDIPRFLNRQNNQ